MNEKVAIQKYPKSQKGKLIEKYLPMDSHQLVYINAISLVKYSLLYKQRVRLIVPSKLVNPNSYFVMTTRFSFEVSCLARRFVLNKTSIVKVESNILETRVKLSRDEDYRFDVTGLTSLSYMAS